MRANFEFINKLGVEWWCFHDRDIAPDAPTLEVLLSFLYPLLLHVWDSIASVSSTLEVFLDAQTKFLVNFAN